MSARLNAVRVFTWAAVVATVMMWAVLEMVGPDWRAAGPNGETAVPGSRMPVVAFDLVDHNGNRVTHNTFADRPLAVFFGFTHCPDVCPTTLQELATMLTEMGPDARSIQVLFISVDTERDTPSALESYITAIDPRFIALTGSNEEVRNAAEGFRVYYKRIEQAGSASYSMDHTSTVFLMDRHHRFVSTIDLHESRTMSLAKLKRLARS